MKTPFYALAALILALGPISCTTYTEKLYTASGYDARDSYWLGLRHGSRDRLTGKAHNPHINDPHEVPAAYRKDYIWGYTEGYRNPYGSRTGGSK